MTQLEPALSQFVSDRLTSYAQKLQVDLPELQSLYSEIYKKVEEGKYGRFSDVPAKEKFTTSVVWGNYVGRPPMSEYTVLPIGFEPKSIAANGAARSSIFAMVAPPGGEYKFTNISCTGEAADIIYGRDGAPALGLFLSYPSVKLARFAQSDGYFADTRTRFDNPQIYSEDTSPEAQVAFYLEYTKAQQISIAEASVNPSKTEAATGYPIRTDFRLIQGLITRKGSGVRDNDTKWANYTIVDDTVTNENKVAPDGRIIYPGLTVWIDPTMQKYSENDECIFVGTVVANKTGKGKDRKADGTYAMNAYNILPVHFDATKAQ